MMQNHEIAEGQSVEVDGYEFKVLSKDAHQIKRVEIQKAQPKQQAATM